MLPGDVPSQLAARDTELQADETAEFEWVEVEFTRSKMMDLTQIIEDVEDALTESGRELLRAELEELGKTPDEIDAAIEDYDGSILGLKPILDPDLEIKPEAVEEGEEGAAPRPGVPVVRPKNTVRPKKPPAVRVRFAKGDKAFFDRATATTLVDDGDATVVRRLRRWRLRDYSPLFNFITSNIVILNDRIARSRHDSARIFVGDWPADLAEGEWPRNLTGGSIFLLDKQYIAIEAYYDKLKADQALFTYELAAVERYEKLVEAQLVATLAQRESLRVQVGALAKKLARIKREQLGRIKAQPASTIKP